MNILISALLLGLGSSLHCAGMCGPLMLFMFQKDESNNNRNSKFIKYGLGKTSAYVVLGTIVGTLGQSVALVVSQQKISLILGILILIITIAGFFFYKFRVTFKPLQWVKMQVVNVAAKKQANYFIFGFLNGLLPCGVVYIALAAAISTGSIFEGALFMFVFGMATLISLFSLVSLAGIGIVRKYLSSKYLLTFTMIATSTLLILRGANLGIKYISPKINAEKAVSCCTKPN